MCLSHTAVVVYTLFLFVPPFDRQEGLPKIDQENGHSLALRNLMACIMQKKWTEILTDDPSYREEKTQNTTVNYWLHIVRAKKIVCYKLINSRLNEHKSEFHMDQYRS